MTIKDVAAKAGVSPSTVSKVLNDSGSVSESKALYVRKIAMELGYHPNARARSLALKATGLVVFIADLPHDAAFINPHIFEIIRGLERKLSANGISLIIKQSTEKEVILLTEKLACGKGADAIVFHASVVSRKLATLLLKLKIPYLVIGQPDFNSRLCWIDINNSLSGEIAARHLIERGYTPISFISGRSDDMISNHRLAGVNKELSIVGMELSRQDIFYTESTIYSGRTAARRFLKQKEHTRAVICANNVIAFGFIEELQSQGIGIPDEIAVIAFDVYPFSRYSEPQLTVVDIDMFALGSDAGKTILDIIANPDLQIQSFTTKPIIIAGHSS